MAYSTYQQLIDYIGEDELVQLTDRAGVDAIDYAVLDAAMGRADARINRYLGPWLPLANVPDDFVQIHCDFTRYFLYKDIPTEHVKQQYDAGITYLEKIAAGKIPLGPDSTGAVDSKTGADIDFQSSAPVFSGAALDGF